MSDIYDLAILGGGPAGITAAIYASRARLNTIWIDKNFAPGGQITATYEVDNYPGFPGINGFDLGMRFREHADGLSCEFQEAEVLRVEENGDGYLVTTSRGELKTKTIVAAMGAEHAKLNIPGEEELAGMGVSYCATCDGNFFRDKDVIVVGGGDSAVADVVYLCRIAQTVHLVHRREELKASPWHAKQLKGIENLVVHWNCIVSDVLQEEGRVSGARLESVLTGETSTIRAQGIFVAIGTRPDTAWLDGIVELDESGYIVADEGGATSVLGLFAAGDVRTTPLRQVVTAVSDGALAAEAAASFLSSC